MQQLLLQQQLSFRHSHLMQPLRQLQRQHRSRSCLNAQSTHLPCSLGSVEMALLQTTVFYAVAAPTPTSLVLPLDRAILIECSMPVLMSQQPHER